MYTNRYICTVLEEMRACFKTLNFAPIPGLIEEAQVMADRMESSIEDKNDLDNMHDRRTELRAELKKLNFNVQIKIFFTFLPIQSDQKHSW